MPAKTSQTKGRVFFQSLSDGPVLMGILNITPDSFSDGGAFVSSQMAFSHAQNMVVDGASIIDVGAESTRPGAVPVSADDEIARLRPVLGPLCEALDVAVSVDTYKADVARWAMGQGAAIINDVWGLQKDPDMAHVIADTQAGVVIMHNREAEDSTLDILADIRRFFDTSLVLADRAGIPEDKIILDPGIGFKKTLSQNYDILQNLSSLKAYKLPLLLGLSRKRMIGELLNVGMSDRLAGTLAANTLGLMRGANILRIHDVRPHRDAIAVFKAMEGAQCLA